MKYLFVLILVLFTFSCNDSKWKAQDPNSVETMNSGKLSFACDESIIHIMDSSIQMYDSQYDRVIISPKIVNSRKAMGELLGGSVRAAIIARDYLADEDSLMKVHDVPKHQRLKAAIDGLVLAVNKDFPIDTINKAQVKDILTGTASFKDFFPEINFEPKIFLKDKNSSEWANTFKLMAENETIQYPINVLNSNDEISELLKSPENLVLTYFSNVLNDEDIKSLRVGFSDSTGKYIEPKFVIHQSTLLRGFYPYTVDYWVYLLEERQNLPYWFASYFAKEEKIQKYFLSRGIVPAFARIRLIPEN